MKLYRALVLANTIIGAILTASGSITAYAGTLGAYRPISLGLAGLGVAQTVLSLIVHALYTPSPDKP